MCKKMKYPSHIFGVGEILYFPQNKMFQRPKITIHNILSSPEDRPTPTTLCVTCEINQEYVHLFDTVPEAVLI